MRRLYLFLVLIFIRFNCFSEIIIVPNIGISFGSQGEYLYPPYSEKLWSYLEWEEKPSANIGIDFLYNLKNNNFKLSFAYALPIQCGKMTDSDWSESGIKYAYSVNKNKIECNLFFETAYNYEFKFNKIISISPIFNLKFCYSSYEARNGYGWYGTEKWSKNGELVPWNDENAHYFPDGKYNLAGIDLFRYTFILGIGFITNLNFNRINISSGLQLSPFSYIYSIDHHLGKNNDFKYEEIQYPIFKYFDLNMQISYKINKLLKLYFKYNLETCLKTKGKSYKNMTSKSYQDSGSDLKFNNFNFGIGFIL